MDQMFTCNKKNLPLQNILKLLVLVVVQQSCTQKIMDYRR